MNGSWVPLVGFDQSVDYQNYVGETCSFIAETLLNDPAVADVVNYAPARRFDGLLSYSPVIPSSDATIVPGSIIATFSRGSVGTKGCAATKIMLLRDACGLNGRPGTRRDRLTTINGDRTVRGDGDRVMLQWRPRGSTSNRTAPVECRAVARATESAGNRAVRVVQ